MHENKKEKDERGAEKHAAHEHVALFIYGSLSSFELTKSTHQAPALAQFVVKLAVIGMDEAVRTATRAV
jgi:hypothetical protein